MKSYIVKSGLFLSSYFPLYIILLLKNTKFVIQCSAWDRKLCYFLIIDILLILLSVCFVICVSKGGKSNSFLVEKLERPSDDAINYIFAYIAPIISFNLDNTDSIIVNIGLFTLIWYMYIKLDLLYINPLLLIFGFISYKTKNGYFISNLDFYDLKVYEGRRVSGYFLSNNIFIFKKE